MYDMHYDLLTIIYYNMKKNNNLANPKKMITDCKKIYSNGNIIGGIINLYFMSKEEMKEELDINEYELADIKTMFQKSISNLGLLKQSGVIPLNTDFIYSIEGCDYFKNENDLEELYDMGLRAILPVWNEKNKFGSGNRSKEGLTDLGVRLIKKAIDLNMIIDVSHANEKTFYDILDVIEIEQNFGKRVNLIASHSNVRTLCDRERNLTDEQLKRLKDLGGYIGLFTNGNFLSKNNEEIIYKERQNNYLKHLDYIINNIGFSIDKILVSTDDMNFSSDKSYHNLEAFPIETINTKLHSLIEKNYNKEIADNILVNNAQKLFKNVKEKSYTNKY